MVVYNIDVDVNLNENKVVATVTLTLKIFEKGVFEEWTIVDEGFDDNFNDVITFIVRRDGKYFKEVKVYDKDGHVVKVVELKELSEDEVVKMIRDRLTNFLKYVLKLDERGDESGRVIEITNSEIANLLKQLLRLYERKGKQK